MPTTAVRTGCTLNYEISGSGDPLLLIMGTSGNIDLWGELVPRLSERHRVVAFDNRGLGGSDRGEGPISVASMAEDTAALLEALDLPRVHTLGWSLGSAVVQELALAHPDRVASAGLFATWGRVDGFQRSVLSALRYPYVHRDLETALAVAGLAFSPQILDDPNLPAMVEQLLPAFPQNDAQMQVTVEQWDADLLHDTLDRLGGITAPALVLVGEQDLLTPPSQAKAVADAIPGAKYELVTGPGSSHCMHLERPADVVERVDTFIAGLPAI
ncbi:MAG: alpha/beta hydrolase [Pseudonocardia sp.]|uniref:alpha/beta fold hydrolase n=1 Tax=unclassified Pseudonocardia TaxID=2619320 RepID=UPI00086911BA|nr:MULTISPECIES: alpha/beta hydrolase [unclassified Pseudonocardia]MBN9107185.1 alpha/beta hydrolase [Pseudonocardia sp.]ODU26940.1 MAG: alpha/beta hydrolase [Pseudonocardia sp. SCN 72-51]ODV05301.1 MAG: alpha/beta hydrolase [Pseudonocardia sp. SCN 73-27]